MHPSGIWNVMETFQETSLQDLFLHFLLETFGQHRDDLVQIAYNAEVSGCEDRCVFVLVDGDDEV